MAQNKQFSMKRILVALTSLCVLAFIGYSFFSASDNAKPKPITLSDFVEMPMPKPVNKMGYCSLDIINTHPSTKASVNIDSSIEPNLTFSGWSVKPDDQSLADGVICIIDNKYVVPTAYGTVRNDVATYLKKPSSKNCGFSGSCAASLFDKGDHVMSIAILGPDKKHYYRLNNRYSNKFGFTLL